jgi:hypothetical protein
MKSLVLSSSWTRSINAAQLNFSWFSSLTAGLPFYCFSLFTSLHFFLSSFLKTTIREKIWTTPWEQACC